MSQTMTISSTLLPPQNVSLIFILRRGSQCTVSSILVSTLAYKLHFWLRIRLLRRLNINTAIYFESPLYTDLSNSICTRLVSTKSTAAPQEESQRFNSPLTNPYPDDLLCRRIWPHPTTPRHASCVSLSPAQGTPWDIANSAPCRLEHSDQRSGSYPL
jgi:hypothetical protein